MRTGFEEFYQPSAEEFARLWADAEIVLDTNVLLNLYRYSAETREVLLDILAALADRLWLPHQAVLEYHRRRPDVIYEQHRIYKAVTSSIASLSGKLRDELKEFLARKHHPVVDVTGFVERVESDLAFFSEEVAELEQEHPDLMTDDPIRDFLTNLYESRVGNPFSSERLADIQKEGVKRYEKEIPPGYSDARKGDENQFGDLVLWYQVLERAKPDSPPSDSGD